MKALQKKWMTSWPVIAAVVALVGPASLVRAQDAADAKAKKLMDQTVSFYKGLDSVQVDTKLKVAISSTNPAFGGEDMNEELKQTLSLVGRESFSVVTEGDGAAMGGADVYFHNGVGTVKIGEEGAIEVKDIKDLNAFLTNEALGYQKDAGMNPLFDQNVAVAVLKSLLIQKPGEAWDDSVTSMEYIGEKELDGKKVHHLRIGAEQNVMGQTQVMDMDLWMEAGDQPLLIKVVPDMAGMMKALADEGNPMIADMKFEVSGSFANWKVNEAIADAAFDADLGDVKKYDDFMGLMTAMMGGGPGGGQPNPAEELVGTPAAAFELELLGGGDAFSLADHKGKHVVVLDFWATWCGPCVRALPELMAAADAFKDRGVKLIAVNQREKPSKITKFLEKQGWDLTVALDTEGRVGDLFRVQGIPQTVIVGKDGLVKKVHVGFSPGLKDQISKELEEFLAE